MAAATTAALSGLGSDLSVSISFNVALELVNAAREAQLGDEELVTVLVLLVVVITVAKSFVSGRLTEARTVTRRRVEKLAEERAARDSSFPKTEFVESSMRTYDESRGLLSFFELLLSLAQRIAVAVAIQVLAVSVKSGAPSRTVRITTLLGVVLFFLFLEQQLGRKI